MKPKSAKAKGRRLQHWVRDLILKEFKVLEPDDVRSTTMGDTGEDIKLSPAARKLLPFNIECKNKQSYSVYKDYKQACSHGNHEPLLIIKENGNDPLVVVDAEWFFNTISRIKNEES